MAARAVFQAAAAAIWCLWSFSRLWVAVISRHSERAADLPRRWKRSIRRLNFVLANTGSIIALFSVEPAAVVGLKYSSHVCVGAAVPPAPGVCAFAGIGRDQDLDAMVDHCLHLLLVPVAGVCDDHL